LFVECIRFPIKRLGAKARTALMNPAADWLIGRWLEGRLNFALRLREGRTSLAAALILVLRNQLMSG
jgi:hypothetical protein